MIDPGPLRDALQIVARHPSWPPSHLAALIGQDADEFVARLEAAAHVAAWVTRTEACCGRQPRFEITAAGRAALTA